MGTRPWPPWCRGRGGPRWPWDWSSWPAVPCWAGGAAHRGPHHRVDLPRVGARGAGVGDVCRFPGDPPAVHQPRCRSEWFPGRRRGAGCGRGSVGRRPHRHAGRAGHPPGGGALRPRGRPAARWAAHAPAAAAPHAAKGVDRGRAPPCCQHSPQRSSHDSVHRAGAQSATWRMRSAKTTSPSAARDDAFPSSHGWSSARPSPAQPLPEARLRCERLPSGGGCHPGAAATPGGGRVPASAQALVDDGHALATAHAHRLEAELAVPRLEAVEERRGDAGAG